MTTIYVMKVDGVRLKIASADADRRPRESVTLKIRPADVRRLDT